MRGSGRNLERLLPVVGVHVDDGKEGQRGTKSGWNSSRKGDVRLWWPLK